jgi:MFS-type transporter involved in bile tolerance (Atg22 family)
LLGGIFGSYLYRINHRYPAILAGLSAILGCIPFYILLHYNHKENGKIWLYIPIAIMAGTGSGITGPIIKATLQNVTLPRHRGQAFALFNVTDDFGRGLGPVFVAGMIRMTGSRTSAFSIGTLGWVICGVLNLVIYFFVPNDEARVIQHGPS